MRSFFTRRRIGATILSILALTSLYFTFTALKHLDDTTEINTASRTGPDANGYGPPVRLASLQNQSVKESSGIAASRRNTGVFWTHNDSGDGPFVYAFDKQGRHRGVWRVADADAQDWEDMALGPGPKQDGSYLYLGDIGDNDRKRAQIIVYRVEEPRVTSADALTNAKSPRTTTPADVIRLTYPDGKHDAEALLVHPSTGDIYIVTKVRGAPAGVYKLKQPAGSGEFTLAYLGEFRFPNQMLGFITGGAVSPEGHRVVLCDYFGACELLLPDKPGTAFDDIWKQQPVTVEISGVGGIRRQGEAICYRADGKALLATSEGNPCPLIEVALPQLDRP